MDISTLVMEESRIINTLTSVVIRLLIPGQGIFSHTLWFMMEITFGTSAITPPVKDKHGLLLDFHRDGNTVSEACVSMIHGDHCLLAKTKNI